MADDGEARDIRGPAPTSLKLVAISGNVRVPSRTEALVHATVSAISNHVPVSQFSFSLVEAGPVLLSSLTREALTPRGLAYIHQVETADILLIGSPIYRASYTGALKHLFDLVDYRALRGAIGLAVATGGTPLHGLAIEHQFRPLLGFFGVTVAATSLYALESDFEGTTLVSPQIIERIDQAAREIAALLPLAVPRNHARKLVA